MASFGSAASFGQANLQVRQKVGRSPIIQPQRGMVVSPDLPPDCSNYPPFVEYVTINPTATTNFVERDRLVRFNGAYHLFWVCSITAQFASSSVFVHFSPLSLPSGQTGNTISPTGTESWLCLSEQLNMPTKSPSRFFKTKNAIDRFFIDADHPAGAAAGGYFITFAGTDDVEFFIANRQ